VCGVSEGGGWDEMRVGVIAEEIQRVYRGLDGHGKIAHSITMCTSILGGWHMRVGQAEVSGARILR